MDISEREMTEVEFGQMRADFDQHAIEHGNPIERSERFGFVAMEDGKFIGASSGLAYRNLVGYAKWFQLTDLFVEKQYRRQGIGATLLHRLEQRVGELGVTDIWTWTAGYEGPEFYEKQGYEVFIEQSDFYSSGHARVGLQKCLDLDRKKA